MSEYVWGVLTPFIAIGGLALLLAAAYYVWKLALYLNSITHEKLLATIKLKKNLKSFHPRNPEPPEYLDHANEFRDVLLLSPKMRLIKVLGRVVIIIRDYREEPTDD